MKFVIFDIDGCISNDERRKPKLPRHATPVPYPQSDYDGYFEDAENDKLINRFTLNYWLASPIENLMIVFITSRPEERRQMTEQWLHDNVPALTAAGHPEWTLLMRPDGELMQTPPLKVKLFEAFAAEEIGEEADAWAEVVAAYDDNSTVLRAYSSRGAEHCIVMDIQGMITLDDALHMRPVEYKLPDQSAPQTKDNVNQPHHYTQGKVEPITIIEDMGDGPSFCRGNVIKYVARYKFKNGLEDLKKARWYLNRLIDLETAKTPPGD